MKYSQLYLLDCDGHGLDSIKGPIDSGRVIPFSCPSLQAFVKATATLIPILHKHLTETEVCPKCKGKKTLTNTKKNETIPCFECGGNGWVGEPVVITDTASALHHTIRGDHKLGIDPKTDLWEKKDQYMGGDKGYLNVYDYITDVTMRIHKNMRAVEAAFDDKGVYQKSPPYPLPQGWTSRKPRIIVICHESEQDDVTVGYKKRAPYVNKALFKSLEANCSDMYRLTSTEEDITDPNGETDGAGNIKILYPKDTRFLRLRKNEECITKFGVEREYVATLPEIIIDPSMQKIWRFTHKKPSFLILYGPPGAGKTSLAVSETEKTASTQVNSTQAA